VIQRSGRRKEAWTLVTGRTFITGNNRSWKHWKFRYNRSSHLRVCSRLVGFDIWSELTLHLSIDSTPTSNSKSRHCSSFAVRHQLRTHTHIDSTLKRLSVRNWQRQNWWVSFLFCCVFSCR